MYVLLGEGGFMSTTGNITVIVNFVGEEGKYKGLRIQGRATYAEGRWVWERNDTGDSRGKL